MIVDEHIWMWRIAFKTSTETPGWNENFKIPGILVDDLWSCQQICRYRTERKMWKNIEIIYWNRYKSFCLPSPRLLSLCHITLLKRDHHKSISRLRIFNSNMVFSCLQSNLSILVKSALQSPMMNTKDMTTVRLKREGRCWPSTRYRSVLPNPLLR